MEQRADRAYRLRWETEHKEFNDREHDMEIWEFPGSDWTNEFYKITPYELPDPVIFNADFAQLARTDYLENDVNWPVMSRRMYYVLCSVGDLPHRVIPIAMLDDLAYPYERERCFISDGQPNPEVTNFDDYVAVQLLEESDYFDFDRSEYEPDPEFPEWALSVKRFVLNEPPKGFPPLFRLSAYSVAFFISAEAREALKEAGIRGTAYYALNDGYSLQDEVDIPVPIPRYP
jgi:hypothetical protein